MDSSETSLETMTPTPSLSALPSSSEVIDDSGATSAGSHVTSSSVAVSTTDSVTGGTDPKPTTVNPVDPNQLFSSYSDTVTESSQFPMQHATQQLPSDQLPIVTTDTVSRTSEFKQSSTASLSKVDAITSAINTKTNTASPAGSNAVTDKTGSVILASSTVTGASDAGSISDQADITADPTTQNVPSVSDTETSDPNSVFDTETSDPNSGTKSLQQSVTESVNLTPTGSIAQNMPSHSSVGLDPSSSSSSVYEATSCDLYSTFTPKQTTFSTVPDAMDSVSLSTSSAVPLPAVTVKPVQPSPKRQSTILGGGLSNYIVYIGVPAVGLVLLILLLVCVVCVRRRKNKQKGSPAKEQNQDLWMNSRPDIPLTTRNQLPETNGGEALSPQKDLASWDIGDTTIRRRKGRKLQKLMTKKSPTPNIATVDFTGAASNNCDSKNTNSETDKEGMVQLDTLPGDLETTLNELDLDLGDEFMTFDDLDLHEEVITGRGDGNEGKNSQNDKPDFNCITGKPLEDSILNERLVELHSDSDDEGCTRYEAVFDFQGCHGNHLTLNQGDIIHVQRKEDTGWWRGTMGGQSGWFPSNYVQSAPDDKVFTQNEIEMHDDSAHVSTFMLKKPNHRQSYPTEEDIRAEPIYCKIQPKDKSSLSDRSASASPAKVDTTDAEYITPTHDSGSQYVALYPYEAHNPGELSIYKGDIIRCKENDKNGWMKGTNDNTRKEGWCPASYLQKVEKEEELAPDPTSYHQLEVNKHAGDKHDLVGIVHKAVHTFNAEKAGDLEFDSGDYITVFQVLENGWWLGSKDKTVGWFPGTFVEMSEQPSGSTSPSPSPVSVQSSPAESLISDDPKQNLDDSSPTNEAGPATPNSHTKLRPNRKAPPPPIRIPPVDTGVQESKLPTAVGNKTPKQSRPKLPPPAPPVRASNKTDNTMATKDIMDDPGPLYEAIGNKTYNKNITEHKNEPKPLYDLMTDSNDSQNSALHKPDKIKPPVPKRYIKPRLVTVPRTEVKLPDLNKGLVNGDLMRLRSPPPPRPVAPKLGPIRAKLTAPKPLEDQDPHVEEDTYFQVNSQRKFDNIVRQDSTEQVSPVAESPPYRTLASFSSFGSTFGKKQEEKTPAKPEPSKPAILEISQQEDVSVKSVEKPYVSPVKTSESDMETNEIAKLSEVIRDTEDDIKSAEKIEENEHQQDNIDLLKDIPVIKPKSGIPLTPKMKASKLPPPKHSLSNITQELPKPDTQKSNDSDLKASTPTEKVSKLPKSKTESVSKLPMSQTNVPTKLSPDHNVFQYPQVPQYEDNNHSPHSVENDLETKVPESVEDDLRPRTDSFGKPPVGPKPKSNTPKVLQKPKPVQKPQDLSDKGITDESKFVENNASEMDDQQKLPLSKQRHSSESESDSKSSSDTKTSSKIPMTSTVTQKSPHLRGRKSGIPAPGGRNPSKDRARDQTGESDTDSTLSPTLSPRTKLESPQLPRKQSPKTPGEQRSLRNRSNSPANRTGIPKSVRNRSNSPAAKQSNLPTSVGSGKSTPKQKRSGLVPPKKTLLNGQGKQNSVDNLDLPQSQDDSEQSSDKDSSFEIPSPKPDRPSKPPRVQKQPSLDGKPPKHGKSLLPVIHKSMESGMGSPNGVSPSSSGSKPKRGIPVAKPARPVAPKSPTSDENHSLGVMKKTLHQAVRGYTARSDGELTFVEGTFVKELSDCDRPGWYVGMLADGTTGLYPADHFQPSPVSAQSEA